MSFAIIFIIIVNVYIYIGKGENKQFAALKSSLGYEKSRIGGGIKDYKLYVDIHFIWAIL